MFMGSTDNADVHIQGSPMAGDVIKMHKRQATCIVFREKIKHTIYIIIQFGLITFSSNPVW